MAIVLKVSFLRFFTFLLTLLAFVFAIYIYISVSKFSAKANNAIGFSAHRSNEYNVAANAIVVFDEELEDTGDAYSSGTFTCPVTGLYFFTVTIYMEFQSAWLSDLEMRDGTDVRKLAGIFNNDSHYLQATNALTISCPAGAQVYVVNRDSTSRTIGGADNGVLRSIFSGFLIQLTS